MGRIAPDLQPLLRDAISGLEAQIWDAADRETAEGIACDVGAPIAAADILRAI